MSALTDEQLERLYSPIGNESAYPELPGIVAELMAEAAIDALRAFADQREDLARMWGGSSAWLTTGDHIANLVVELAADAASDIEAGEVL